MFLLYVTTPLLCLIDRSTSWRSRRVKNVIVHFSQSLWSPKSSYCQGWRYFENWMTHSLEIHLLANGLLSRLMSAIGDLLSAIRYCVTELLNDKLLNWYYNCQNKACIKNHLFRISQTIVKSHKLHLLQNSSI